MTFSNTRVSETDTETSEALGFLRQARARELAKDPVHWYHLTALSGQTTGDVLECHESHAAELNEARLWRYVHSQKERERAREEARAEFKRTYGYFGSENPPVIYSADDYLWRRVSHPSGPVVRVEGTARCKHD